MALTVSLLDNHKGASTPKVVGDAYYVDAAIVMSVYNIKNSATCTITITDYTELNAGDKVNLIATDGTNYDFAQGDQSSVEGTFEATTSNNTTATGLMNCINTSSGPSGTRFTATVLGAVVTVTQSITGSNGNTVVSLTDSGTAGMTKTNFVNGDEGDTVAASDLKLDTITSATILGHSQPALYTANILCAADGSYIVDNPQVINSFRISLLDNSDADDAEEGDGTNITDTTLRMRIWGSKGL